MMKTKFLILTGNLLTGLLFCNFGFAQDSVKAKKKLELSPLLNFYYRYNLSDPPKDNFNNYTSFTNSNNVVNTGLGAITANYEDKKFFANVAVGTGERAVEFGNTQTGMSINLIHAYMGYAFSPKITFTVGKWPAMVGEETLMPSSNKNYSMSYSYTYAPSYNMGAKLGWAIDKKTNFIIGLTNFSNAYTTTSATKVLISQINTKFFDEKLTAILNYEGYQKPAVKMNQLNLLLQSSLSKAFGVDLDANLISEKTTSSKTWWSTALYFNYYPKGKNGVSLRAEYLDDKENLLGFNSSIMALTLSGNIYLKNFRITPELRWDDAPKNKIFLNKNNQAIRSTPTLLLSVLYSLP